MVRLLSLDDVSLMIKKIGIRKCFAELIDALRNDYAKWDHFYKSPRHATHYPHGVIELMPISDDRYYAYKYVNGHPSNPESDKMTVVAMGALADVSTGYPLLISEMTVLTAMRTAATSALASTYLARKNSKMMGIIGTGSQGEFQVLAHHVALGINTVRYFDIDPQAMEKFANNLADFDLELLPCNDIESTIEGVDVIITATAEKNRLSVLNADWIKPGVHINGVGGDCPGKTELDPGLLHTAKIVVEYLEQTKLEGEIQNLESSEIYAELWELAADKKPGRENEQEITIFDSVGFALEDYSILKYVHGKADAMNIGEQVNLIPALSDPKDLFSLIK